MGYRPTEGEKAKVRYRFYGQDSVVLSSNVGEGLVVKAEIERAANDSMRIRTGDFELVRKVALGDTKLQATHRSEALVRLYRGKFDRGEVMNVLEVVAKDADKGLAETASQLLHYLKHGEPMWLNKLMQHSP
jgi:hypothetical protein